MSTFHGKMREYGFLSIDRFDGDNLKSGAFFLSHCHSDHMTGLSDDPLLEKLQCSKARVYCSSITKSLLLKARKYSHLAKFIVSLPLEESTILKVEDNFAGKMVDIQVTLLPAGHCPGSVMFLFEGAEGTVLYTGDFRLESTGTRGVDRMVCLHNGERVKDIKSVYVDTTFCIPEAVNIATRDEGNDKMADVVQEWIRRSRHHVVWLNCKTQYGYENIFVNLWRRLGVKVHVTPFKLSLYVDDLPDIAEALTIDSDSTQIHACRPSHVWLGRPPCKNGYGSHVLIIKPSILWYTMHASLDGILQRINKNYVRVCYSMHASYKEVRDFIAYLKPKFIYPSVAPMDSSVLEVKRRLRHLQHHSLSTSDCSLDGIPSPFVPLGKLKADEPMLQLTNLDYDGDSIMLNDSPVKLGSHASSGSLPLEFPGITAIQCKTNAEESDSGKAESQIVYINDDSEDEESIRKYSQYVYGTNDDNDDDVQANDDNDNDVQAVGKESFEDTNFDRRSGGDSNEQSLGDKSEEEGDIWKDSFEEAVHLHVDDINNELEDNQSIVSEQNKKSNGVCKAPDLVDVREVHKSYLDVESSVDIVDMEDCLKLHKTNVVSDRLNKPSYGKCTENSDIVDNSVVSNQELKFCNSDCLTSASDGKVLISRYAPSSGASLLSTKDTAATENAFVKLIDEDSGDLKVSDTKNSSGALNPTCATDNTKTLSFDGVAASKKDSAENEPTGSATTESNLSSRSSNISVNENRELVTSECADKDTPDSPSVSLLSKPGDDECLEKSIPFLPENERMSVESSNSDSDSDTTDSDVMIISERPPPDCIGNSPPLLRELLLAPDEASASFKRKLFQNFSPTKRIRTDDCKRMVRDAESHREETNDIVGSAKCCHGNGVVNLEPVNDMCNSNYDLVDLTMDSDETHIPSSCETYIPGGVSPQVPTPGKNSSVELLSSQGINVIESSHGNNSSDNSVLHTMLAVPQTCSFDSDTSDCEVIPDTPTKFLPVCTKQ